MIEYFNYYSDKKLIKVKVLIVLNMINKYVCLSYKFYIKVNNIYFKFWVHNL